MEKRGKSFKEHFKKFWFLLWKDDSFKGWIFSVIFLFIFITFIFFPVLRLATGTVLPMAIVESCSMYHQGDLFGNFDSWWQRHETKYFEFKIDKNTFQEFSFSKGFNKGDILFMIGANPDKIKIGDIIIFDTKIQGKNPLIHRVISIKEENGEKIFSTIGDNNNGQLSVEEEIFEDQLVAKAVFKVVPFVGWAKLIFYEYIRPEYERGMCREN
jgi:signal peptidase I